LTSLGCIVQHFAKFLSGGSLSFLVKEAKVEFVSFVEEQISTFKGSSELGL